VRNIRILVIEDDKIDQMAFKRFAKDENLSYDYVVAGSVSEAKTILNSEKFDIVITDYFLGDGTAFDIFDLIKDTPIIIVTGSGDEEVAVKAMKVGAYDYLLKDPERNYLKVLPITVENAIKHKQAEEALKESLVQLSKKSRYETIISAVTRSVHQSINLQDVLENAVESMSQNIDEVQHVAIYLVEGEEAVLKAYRGYPDWFVERVSRIPYPKDFTWKTIIEGKPRYCSDVDNDTVIGRVGREIGIMSYLSMPIRFEDEVVGCINASSLQKNAFSEEELKLLEIVAQQIETAIDNAKQTEILQQSEERYRTLFDQSPVGVYLFNKDFKITQCNERMVEILQSSYDKIIGLDVRELKDQSFVPAMKNVFEGQSSYQEGFYKATTSPVKLWLSLRFSPLRDANGNVIGGMAVVEDITERKQTEEE
jgi:PAS domain S-box-containing protein